MTERYGTFRYASSDLLLFAFRYSTSERNQKLFCVLLFNSCLLVKITKCFFGLFEKKKKKTNKKKKKKKKKKHTHTQKTKKKKQQQTN